MASPKGELGGRGREERRREKKMVREEKRERREERERDRDKEEMGEREVNTEGKRGKEKQILVTVDSFIILLIPEVTQFLSEVP